MKLAALAVFALSSLSFASAQQRIISYDYKFERHNYFSATAIKCEENNGLLLSLTNSHSIKRVLINAAGRYINLLEQFFSANESGSDFKHQSYLAKGIEDFYKKSSFVGGVYYNGKIIEVMRSRYSFDFYFIGTNLGTGANTIEDTLKSEGSERIIACFNKQEKLYLLTYIINTNKLNIYEKTENSRINKTQIDINLSNLGKVSNQAFSSSITEFSDIFRKGNFAVYENNMRYPVLFTAIRNKAYVQKNNVIFSVTSNNLNAYLINIDLEKRTYTIQTFDQDETAEENTGDATTASCLVDHFLVTCHAKQGKLKLNIFDSGAGTLLKSFSIDETNISSITSNELQKTGSFLSKSDIVNADFDKFYRTARANKLSMTGYIDKGKLFLSFAAPYKQFINGTTLLNIAMTAAGTFFINTAPNSYGYFLSYGRGTQNPTYVGFDATIDLQNINFTKASPDFSTWDKLGGFMESRKLGIYNCSFVYMNDNYYLGYPSSLDDKYYIYRFNEKESAE